MADNQITPFQLTDQFTMDNFNQRINETNTALQNNDPRNWGLDLSKFLTDANDGTRNGFYTMTVGAANVPFDYGVLLVHNLGNPNYVHQELTEFLSGIKACRGGTWDDSASAVKWNPWEWVNPPMQLGVEYRTTERYLGNPVYVKVIEAGFNPAGTVKVTSDKTVSASGLVRFSAVRGGWSFPSLMYGGTYDDSGDIQVSVQAASGGIHVYTWSKTRDMTSATAMVSVYYTKD